MSGLGAVTAADVVAGHVSLDISCLDRLYLTGFVPGLQTPGGVLYFLHEHRGKPIASPAVFEQIGNRNQYVLTPDGQLFAHIYTKVYNRVLHPLMAPDRPNAPPELAHALHTIDRIVTEHLTEARVPTAVT